MEGKKYILALDDDPDFNAFLEKTIRNFQYDIRAYTSPDLFFQDLINRTPELCIIDLNFGDFHNAGLRYIRTVRQICPLEIPIIVISGNDDAYAVKSAKSDGATYYLYKPLNASILRFALKKIFESRPQMQNASASVNANAASAS